MEEHIKKEKVAGYVAEHETKETHPAFGMISLSRVSCTPAANLYGSSIKHGNFITLRISKGHRTTSIYRDWYSADESIVEVCLSGTQLGDMLTNMNCGDGVPVTINRIGHESIPDIADESNLKTESNTQLKEQLNKAFEVSEQLMKSAETLLNSSTPLKKDEKKELLWKLEQIRRSMTSSIIFAGECFDKKVDKQISEARGEIECYLSNRITNAGLQALGGIPLVQIGDKNED